MSRDELMTRANILLDEHESAPSAVLLVLAHLFGDIADDMVDRLYANGEGANDTLREHFLMLCSDVELKAIIHDIESEIIEQELL